MCVRVFLAFLPTVDRVILFCFFFFCFERLPNEINFDIQRLCVSAPGVTITTAPGVSHDEWSRLVYALLIIFHQTPCLFSNRHRRRDGRNSIVNAIRDEQFVPEHVLEPNDIRPDRRLLTYGGVVKRRKVAVSFTKRRPPRARDAERVISKTSRSAIRVSESAGIIRT